MVELCGVWGIVFRHVDQLWTLLLSCVQVKLAPLVSDEARKWLSWDAYIQLVRRLQLECAGVLSVGAFWCVIEGREWVHVGGLRKSIQ